MPVNDMLMSVKAIELKNIILTLRIYKSILW